MSKAIFYHNPRCSKSREALAFVQEQINNLIVIEYLKTPLDKAELLDIFKKLGIQSAHQMIRPKEKEFDQAGLSTESNDDEVLTAVAKFPKLLERPILVYKNRAAIGRPLDHIVSLLHD
jgi:arsenate reductase